MFIAKPHVVQTPTLFSWSIEPAEIQWFSNVVSVNIQRTGAAVWRGVLPPWWPDSTPWWPGPWPVTCHALPPLALAWASPAVETMFGRQGKGNIHCHYDVRTFHCVCFFWQRCTILSKAPMPMQSDKALSDFTGLTLNRKPQDWFFAFFQPFHPSSLTQHFWRTCRAAKVGYCPLNAVGCDPGSTGGSV